MNRTRKVEAAAIGVAVILAIIAMVAFTPNLHTQTPVSTSPPTSGGTNTGGGSNSGTGPGTANQTASNCNVTGDDHAWDNETEGNGTHAWDGASPMNGTEDHDWGECNATAGDHDGMGDQMSDGHHGHGEDGLVLGAIQDALSLVPLLSAGLSAAWNALGPVTGVLAHAFVGLLGSGVAS